MKFYIPNICFNSVSHHELNWLVPAEFNWAKRSIYLYEYSNGWIADADDSFNSFFTLTTGNKLPTITDAEYNQYVLDKVAFFSKTRAEEFRTAWAEFQPKINSR
jgi:hypothetical protein